MSPNAHRPNRPTRSGSLEAQLRQQWGDNLVDIALTRIELGDVRLIPYPADGIPTLAVRCREELGDDRSDSGSGNYWPERNACCLCWQCKKSGGVDGMCSHTIAMQLHGGVSTAEERRRVYLADWAEAHAENQRHPKTVREARAKAKATAAGRAARVRSAWRNRWTSAGFENVFDYVTATGETFARFEALWSACPTAGTSARCRAGAS